MTVVFELDGRDYIALNGGPHFAFSDGVSILVQCETQEEVDRYWGQVVPRILGQYMSDPDQVRAQRVMAAMMDMKKIDIAVLKKAYEDR